MKDSAKIGKVRDVLKEASDECGKGFILSTVKQINSRVLRVRIKSSCIAWLILNKIKDPVMFEKVLNVLMEASDECERASFFQQ